MLTQNQKCLSLSGGRLITMEQTFASNYAANGQHFPWEEDIDVINTPDIDPSFFNDDPFKKFNNNCIHINGIELGTEDNLIIGNQNCINSEDSSQMTQQSLEDHVFIDLSQLISQSTDESINNQSMVSPNDVLANAYIPSTTAPVLHYLQPNKTIESMISAVSIPVITTTANSLIEINASHTQHEPISSLSQPPLLSTPTPSSPSYITSSSPALSYTSTTSESYLVPSVEELMSSDSNTMERKPDLTYAEPMPTVINDHLYTLPSTSPSTKRRRKSSVESSKDNKYLTVRKKNNMASKKSRITKRDKQKQMEEKIAFYIEDNQKCAKEIERMEREIEWCKNYLFKRVVSTPRS